MRPTRPAGEADAHGRRPTTSTTMSSLKNRVLGGGGLKPRRAVSLQICSKKAPAPVGSGRGRDQQTIARTWMRMSQGGGSAGRGRPGATSHAVRRRKRGGRGARRPGWILPRTATMLRRTLTSRCPTTAGQRTTVTDPRNRTSLPLPPTQMATRSGTRILRSRSSRKRRSPVGATDQADARDEDRAGAAGVGTRASSDERPRLPNGTTTWTPT